MTLFRRDGRSFAAMAGKEYYALVKSSMSSRCESNAVRHFATFYSERCTECGGTFEVDPKWELQLYNPGADAGKDSDADILERIRLLPEATEFEKRSSLRSCIGYQLWLEPKYTKSSTRSYVSSVMTL